MASLYASYHGADGLKKIAERIHTLTQILAGGLEKLGHKVTAKNFFDTICVEVKSAAEILKIAETHRFNFRQLAILKLEFRLMKWLVPSA